MRASALWPMPLLFFASCVKNEQVRLPLPPQDNAKAAIFAIEQHDRILSVHAISLAESGMGTIRAVREGSARADATIRVTALLYDTTLDQLVIPEGELLRGSDSEGDRPLPPASEVYELTIEDGAPSSWAMAAAPNGAVNAFRMKRGDGCIELRSSVIALEGARTSGVIAVDIDERTALVATREGIFYRVTADAAERLTALSTSTPHLAAFRGPDPEGDIWLLGAGSHLVRGDPERGFAEVAPRPSWTATQSAALAGSRSGVPFELFAVMDGRAIERFDGVAWAPIDYGALEDMGSANGVAWLGPGDALAFGPRSSSAIHYRDGRVDLERFQGEGAFGFDTARSILEVPGFGTLIGGRSGVLYRLAANVWNQIRGIGGTAYAGRVRSMATFRGGIFFGGENGVVGQYRIGENTFCVPRLYGTGDIDVIHALGPNLLLLPRSDGDADRSVIVLTPE